MRLPSVPPSLRPPHITVLSFSQSAGRVLCVSAAALGSRVRGSGGWGRGAGRGSIPASPPKVALAQGAEPLPTPHPYLFPLSLCCVSQHFPGCCCHPPSQPPAPREPAAVYLTKSLVYFYLLDCPCTLPVLFPGLTASSGQQAWLGSPSPCQGWGRTHQFLFILSLDLPVVEGKADVRRGRGPRWQCWGPRDQGEGGEHVRDRSDLLALGLPAQDPCPAPKASTAPRP